MFGEWGAKWPMKYNRNIWNYYRKPNKWAIFNAFNSFFYSNGRHSHESNSYTNWKLLHTEKNCGSEEETLVTASGKLTQRENITERTAIDNSRNFIRGTMEMLYLSYTFHPNSNWMVILHFHVLCGDCSSLIATNITVTLWIKRYFKQIVFMYFSSVLDLAGTIIFPHIQ